jgi:hypothetical protein
MLIILGSHLHICVTVCALLERSLNAIINTFSDTSCRRMSSLSFRQGDAVGVVQFLV